ncbi:MAG TPA: DUF885 family protein [Thermoanaerobaculia bacterium]|jgi:hypothetical protein|nr:DUF885 family protein [Thermoanaerobaculia bacterium]
MTLLKTSALALSVYLSASSGGSAAPGGSYDQLVAFFKEWRTFQKPRLVDGVPDYSAAAMAAQQRGLEDMKRRLAAIDPSGWPIPQQVDYQVVRAELSGLDFDHRVLKPWANNPGFYVTVFNEESDQPAREGPFALGAVELWSYPVPLSPENAAAIAAGLKPVPALLAQAKANLTGNQRDLWTWGTKALRDQSKTLADFGSGLDAKAPAALRANVDAARKATDDLVAWLDERAASKNGPSGVGIANYDWYLKHVQLVPYTWAEVVTLMERELARSRALLAMEEIRNAALPPLVPVASADEYDRRFNAAVTEYMAFLKDREILTVTPDMDPALRARIGKYSAGPREFFAEVDYRDPEVMRTHGYHWFDKARMAHDPNPSPIRKDALLYNIFNTRTEGHATGWEELMMQAGMFDARPRARELVYILVAERAARALGELSMQANVMTLEQAAAFACANTPRGWLRMDGHLVRGEQHLYLQQPGYGPSYLIGKIEIEKLIADRREQLGDRFTMKGFMDGFNAVGLIPATLVRWEMTGKQSPALKKMLAP